MSIKLTAIEGNGQRLDGGAMFGNAPKAVWEKWIAPDDRNRIPLACRALLIEWDDKKILCEAGIGTFMDPKLADRFGVQDPSVAKLIENLKRVGVTPSDIDYVILSHLHFDHAGGILPSFSELQQGNEKLLFPNAQYLVGKVAFERSLDPHPRDKASFVPGLAEKLKATGKLHIIGDDSDIPGELRSHLSFRFSQGHTPGQMHTVFGESSKVIFCGDLIPGASWVHLPITMGYDRYPERVIDEKQSLYDVAVDQRWLLFFTHDPKIAGAYVRRTDKGRFEPDSPIVQMESLSL